MLKVSSYVWNNDLCFSDPVLYKLAKSLDYRCIKKKTSC